MIQVCATTAEGMDTGEQSVRSPKRKTHFYTAERREAGEGRIPETDNPLQDKQVRHTTQKKNKRSKL